MNIGVEVTGLGRSLSSCFWIECYDLFLFPFGLSLASTSQANTDTLTNNADIRSSLPHYLPCRPLLAAKMLSPSLIIWGRAEAIIFIGRTIAVRGGS